jgi:hypothetical protein
MFIPRLAIINSVREVGRIVKIINQPMQYKLTRLKKLKWIKSKHQVYTRLQKKMPRVREAPLWK